MLLTTHVLAVDQSTETSSAAIFKDAALVSERAWTEDPSRNQHLFTMLPLMFSEAGVQPAEIDLFAVDVQVADRFEIRYAQPRDHGRTSRRNRFGTHLIGYPSLSRISFILPSHQPP